MARRGTIARRLVVVGVLFSFAAWVAGERRVERREQEPQPLIPDALVLAGARGLDPPRGRRPLHTRLVATIAFAVIFCAGAALTAGAGNEVAKSMEESPIAEATVATDDTTAVATDAAVTTDAVTTDAAPAETVAEDPTPAPEPEPLPPAAEAPAADAAPAEPAAEAPAADPSDATPAKPDLTSEPATVAAPVSAPAAPAVVTRKAAAPVRHKPKAKPFVRIPYSAIAFDPQRWLQNNASTDMGAAAVALSTHYLGVPYVWGGAVPATGFDCSGLTRFVYEQLGVRLPHYAASQFAMFPKVAPTDLRPGDLVFFEPKIDGPGHVALYAGNDRIIEAPHTGALVRYATLSGAASALGFMGAVRPYGAPLATQFSTFVDVMSTQFARAQ